MTARRTDPRPEVPGAGAHTPTPWVVTADNQTAIADAQGRLLTVVTSAARADERYHESDRRDEANAALIVRAVNAHVALVEALERMLRCADLMVGPDVELRYAARAALALARGER